MELTFHFFIPTKQVPFSTVVESTSQNERLAILSSRTNRKGIVIYYIRFQNRRVTISPKYEVVALCVLVNKFYSHPNYEYCVNYTNFTDQPKQGRQMQRNLAPIRPILISKPNKSIYLGTRRVTLLNMIDKKSLNLIYKTLIKSPN